MIASEQTDGNRSLRDRLYTIDGKPLLTGLQRGISINEQENTLSMETPGGRVFCRIIRHHF